MSRIVYVNGRFVPESEAQVSVFDRGFLFGDGVYEVSSVLGRGLVDNAAHLARLERSLGALGMAPPATPEEIVRAQKELIARNDLDEGVVYLQITRGPADRDFAYPAEPRPTLVMFTQEKPSSTIHASPAPASSAACFAIDAASSPTVFTSRRFQRRSGTVTTVIPRAASGLSTSGFSCVNMTSVGLGSAGYAKSRSAGPRVICR